jgi:hypothetical protein
VHSIYTIFFKSSLLTVFRLLVIEQIYIFIGLFMYHNGHCMFNIHNILEICFPSKSSGDWLSLYRVTGYHYIDSTFFSISFSILVAVIRIKLRPLRTLNLVCYKHSTIKLVITPIMLSFFLLFYTNCSS